MATRLYTFKWRLSKILGPQYEILMCEQYGPDFGVFRNDKGLIAIRGEEFSNNDKAARAWLPILRKFRASCETGGGELFKAFLLGKFTRKFTQVTECVVGVLDKAVLLESLQQLPNNGGKKWENVQEKVKMQAREGKWNQLDFSKEWILLLKDGHTTCQLLKWTASKEIKWNSPKLHRILYGWAMGIYKVRRGEQSEWPEATSEYTRRLICSSILG